MNELFPRKSFLPQNDDIKDLPYPFNMALVQRLGEDEQTVAENSAGSVK